ncbi:SusD/RagB family nutrient-binding outer membrane lipoprotein [Flagellimonas sp. HMM57]|uniref:SusD/RagB family nutrient-binding outer membrane lipoprotein n=1 Tax=unclassified Flagellimonas TaxID=2644544 RepID=UPI0013D8360B|nr:MULTISPECIES: SusD/RagB family nutrient-binding outer membrane lipoprotein [unclassified Flagellimonas]UII74748.1 SusD/RagB family nutrient-binding outer membrane lipoprotein [Flagellimonas sp. HMM57]
MKIKSLIITMISAIFIMGCTEDFVETNTNPTIVNTPTFGSLFNPILQNPTRNYQRNVNLFADFYAQYWGNLVDGFESPRYEYVNPWLRNKWLEFYTQTLQEANTLIDIYGEDPVYTNVLAQLDIWIVAEWVRMLNAYGDLPYFDAGKGINDVPYSPEQEIYYDLFDRLDAAVKVIDSSDESQVTLSEDDLIYNGDAEKWKRFANSLRLRLAMRLANVDPGKAQAEAAAAINLGVMTTNDDVARIPLWRDGFYDYLHIISNIFVNIRVSETFTNYLYSEAGFEDPRASRWLAYNESSPLNGGDFVGVKNGFDIVPEDAVDFATMKTEDFDGEYIDFVGDGGAILLYKPIMFYSEVLFLQAEAALRGWVPGDANGLYQQGIQASMDHVGVDPGQASAYIAAVPTLTGSNEAQLKQLITQKWIANFPNGAEAWADFRRTDYPDITLPVDGVSSNATVAQDTWVKRLRYPDEAHDLDSELMPSQFNTIQTNRMDARLWWDTADTKTKSGGLMNSNF